MSDEVLFELLTAWENWSGPLRAFYTALGVSSTGMASMLGKAKKLKKKGYFSESEFKEIKVAESSPSTAICRSVGITLRWSGGRVIRFPRVDELIEFLDKTEKETS